MKDKRPILATFPLFIFLVFSIVSISSISPAKAAKTGNVDILISEDWESYNFPPWTNPEKPWEFIKLVGELAGTSVAESNGEMTSVNNDTLLYRSFSSPILSGIVRVGIDVYLFDGSDLQFRLDSENGDSGVYFFASNSSVVSTDHEFPKLCGNYTNNKWVNIEIIANFRNPTSLFEVSVDGEITQCTVLSMSGLFQSEQGSYNLDDLAKLIFIVNGQAYVDNIEVTCEDCTYSVLDDDDDDGSDDDDNADQDDCPDEDCDGDDGGNCGGCGV
jgi:hypothetical protein